MVLVDTSSWIDFFKNPSSIIAQVIDQLLEDRLVCTIDLIVAEIVPSATNDKNFIELKDYFSALPKLEEIPNFWEKIIENQYQLKKAGVYKIALPDVMIATFAINHLVQLLTKDKDFERMAKVLPIKLWDPDQ